MERENESTMTAPTPSRETRRPVDVLGIPVTAYTTAETVDRLDELVKSGGPAYIVTANLNYAMLCSTDDDLHDVNERAAFVVADGAPLVWWSRLIGQPLPERVAGSDLIYLVNARAAERGYRVYLLGAGPGVADEVAAELIGRYPDLKVVGTESPPFRPLTDEEQAEQFARIRAASPDILMLAFKMPDGERWLRDHTASLGVPLVLQFGASFDFVAGRVDRAPRWMQRTGLEWLHRTLQEPRRLAGRYGRNFAFLGKALLTGRWISERRQAR
jgi:N-acetylglucosaminyldiphosphoundecaprenol N-acetyl-beta-D-mannosaminyltransferase